MHCDVDQEDSVAHIWQCLDEIGVERIDHGVNALEDDGVVEEIKRRGLGLTGLPDLEQLRRRRLKAQEIKALLDARRARHRQLGRSRLLPGLHGRRTCSSWRERRAFPTMMS